MDFHSMFEEMHSAMAEMMEVRRTMMDRMFGSFGGSMFPSFPLLLEDFDRDFRRDFAFPRIPRLTQEATGQAPPRAQQAVQPTAPQPQQAGQGPALGSSVMYSSQQYYNSAEPSKNYSRHTTTQSGPAGVLESRTAVRDHGEGVERVEVRRQLGDRFTHVTRKRRLDTGEETVEKKTHNVPEEEVPRFEEEWSKLAKEHLPMYCGREVAQAQATPQLASSQGATVADQPKASEVGNIPIGSLPAQGQGEAQAQAQPHPTPMQQQQ